MGGTARRLALEHDDRHFDVAGILWAHQRTGARLIFDALHHRLYNPRAIPAPEALAICLSTWPPGQTPKIHFAMPATEMVRDRKGRVHPPRLNRHSHYINPLAFIDFLRSMPPMRDFDVMLEGRARDWPCCNCVAIWLVSRPIWYNDVALKVALASVTIQVRSLTPVSLQGMVATNGFRQTSR